MLDDIRLGYLFALPQHPKCTNYWYI
jgi:hypothetical protein